MLTKFKVENFKSIHSLELELGRVNVFIGENGSGKSNVLEAVALASAALQDRLDHEFLAPRGIRVTAPELMRSGFDKKSESKFIFLRPWFEEKGPMPLALLNGNQRFERWRSVMYDRDPEFLAFHSGEVPQQKTNSGEPPKSFSEAIGSFIKSP